MTKKTAAAYTQGVGMGMMVGWVWTVITGSGFPVLIGAIVVVFAGYAFEKLYTE